jgi:hypothetical protein
MSVCCEVSATGRSLVQRSPTECVMSDCDSEALVMRRQWPTGGLLHRRGRGVVVSSVFEVRVHIVVGSNVHFRTCISSIFRVFQKHPYLPTRTQNCHTILYLVTVTSAILPHHTVPCNCNTRYLASPYCTL